MQVPNRFESIEDYRYGFQGQEKDDEIKGEGNSLNYTFRMHDPRVGRFLSLDPISAQYPHNSPFAFSENRVIDGIELEGAEYLYTGEEKAEFYNGVIVIKLSNFTETFKKAWLNKFPNTGLVHYSSDVGYYGDGVLREAFILEPVPQLSHPSTSGDPNTRPDNSNRNEYSITRTMKKTKTREVDKRNRYSFNAGQFTGKGEYTNDYGAPAPKIKGSFNLVLLTLDVYNSYNDLTGDIDVAFDKHDLDAQTRDWNVSIYNSNTSIVTRVLKDIKTAIKKGIIKEENVNVNDLSQIANIVMFGGNGTEARDIKEAGMRIVREVSKNDKTITISDEQLKKLNDKEFKEQSETKKDNTVIKID
jgi:RHS repeat-associated protein